MHWILLGSGSSLCMNCPKLNELYNLAISVGTNKNSRLEDTITFHLIERVQFALNNVSGI